MGVGTGHLKSEFAILGQTYDDRHERTDQGIRDMRSAWSGKPSQGHQMLPRPIQRPGPPVWIGGNSPRSIRRAVELGDGWAPMPNPRSNALGARSPALESADDLVALLEYARSHARSVGRTSPFDVAVMPLGAASAGDVSDETLVESAEQLAAAGATYLILRLQAADRAEWIDRCRRVGRDVIPRIASIQTHDPLNGWTTP
jgi:alkanesulfonate monooxygenase SsuD/methylene tetrahydromethanopterin reductase-like flavin-dependent oxidoreductase (luciferase family)